MFTLFSYFHPRIGLTGDEDFKRPLYEMLEDEHLIVANLSKEEISAEAANQETAEKLDVGIGSPILVRKRFVFDQGDRAMEFNLGYYNAESFVLYGRKQENEVVNGRCYHGWLQLKQTQPLSSKAHYLFHVCFWFSLIRFIAHLCSGIIRFFYNFTVTSVTLFLCNANQGLLGYTR